MSAEEIALGIVGLIAGVLNMPINQWLKNKLSLDDTSAVTLSIAISVLVAVIALIAAGQLNYLDFTWDNLPAVVTLVYGLGVIVYNAIRGSKS